MSFFYRATAYLLQFTMILSGWAGLSFAGQIVPADNATFKYVAPNGVPVVNIAKPNSRGLSHNRYNQFSVNANGAVLVNTPNVLQSQLAGAIRGNPNLNPSITPGGRTASIILNEVTSTNRSVLKGFVEVHGQRADVIIANPNGITANGLGFINTNRAVLTTGTPNIAGGVLTGFDVLRGDLVVQGAGIVGTSQNFLDLVVRSLKLNGQVNATDLHITTGANRWDYVNRTQTGLVGTGVAPLFAVDTSLLGGMYANRIKLVATEAGVGVRMLGDTAASVDDIRVSSAGIVELKNKVSAKRDLLVTYNGTQANGNVLINGASLTSGRDMSLSSSKGVELAQSSLTATRNLVVNSATFMDRGTLLNTRSAGNNITLTSSAQSLIDGSKWQAGNDFIVTTGNFLMGTQGGQLFSGTNAAKLGKSMTITASTGDVNLAAGALTSANLLTLTSATGAIVATSGAGQSIKATNAMSLNARTGLSNGGQFLAGGNITLRRSDNVAGVLSLTNSGRIQAGGSLDMGGFANTGTLTLNNQAGGVLLGNRLILRGQTLSNAGAIQGTAGSTVNISGGMSNTGTWIASNLVSADGVFNLGSLSNSGTIQSLRHINVNAVNGITNSGNILASNNLALKTNGAFNATAGVIQAGASLSIGGSAGVYTAALTNGSGSRLLGNSIILSSGNLNNAGVIQARTGSNISVNGLLINKGKMIFSNAAGAVVSNVSANYISNAGVLQDQSGTNYSLKRSGRAFDNLAAASILSSGTVHVISTAPGAWALVNAGRVQGASIYMSGSAASPMNISNYSSGVLKASNNLTIGADVVTNLGTIQSDGGSALLATNFDNTSVNSLYIGSGTGGSGTMSLSGTLTNAGAVHANGNLAISAATLTNSNTAAYSALGDLSLTAKNNFTNDGALYAGGILSVTANKVLFKNSLTGTMDGGSMMINAARFHNYNNLNAVNNITINTTKEFKNLVTITGGSLIASKTTYQGMSAAELGRYNNQGANRTSSYFRQARFSPSSGSFANSNAAVVDDSATGTFSLINGITITPNPLVSTTPSDPGLWSVLKYQAYYYETTHGAFNTVDGHYVRGYIRGQKKLVEKNILTGTAKKAQILAGGTLTVNIGAGLGLNYGSVLSANTININGTGSFTNNALHHTSDKYFSKYKFYVDYIDWSGKVDVKDFFYERRPGVSVANTGNWVRSSEVTAKSRATANPEFKGTTNLGGIGAGVFANTLNVNVGGSVVNEGAPVSTSATPTTQNGAGASAFAGSVGGAGLANGLSIAGLNITLPTNPNGFFVLTKSSNAAFLVEGNPRFGLDSGYLGSNYLWGKLKGKLNTKSNIRRLGDAAYENYLIKEQLIKKTGRNVLKQFHQDTKAQLRALYDNAAETAENMKLDYGVALTKDQINSLKHDIVWMVKKHIKGQEVLVPIVYLSKATLDGSDPTGATLSAGNMNIKAKDFKNNGGTVVAENKLNIKTKGDIENISGTISGGSIKMKSLEGSIVNKTFTQETGGDQEGHTQIGKTASIKATGDMELDAKKDIKSIGADIEAGGNASLTAGRDVVFDTIQEKHHSKTYSKESTSSGYSLLGAGNSSSSSKETLTSNRSIKHHGSGLKVGGNLKMKAGRDIVVAGSDVEVSGDADLNAKRNQKFIAREDVQETNVTTISTSSHTKSGGVFSGDSETTTNTKVERDMNFKGVAKTSNLKVGGNLTRKAGKTLLDEGTDIRVGGNYKQEAGTVLNVAAKDRSLHKNDTTVSKSSLKTSGDFGALSSEVKSELNVDTTTKSVVEGGSTARAGTIKVGGNFTTKSENKTLLEGTKIDVKGNIDVEAGSLDVAAARDTSFKSETTRKESINNTTTMRGGLETGVEVLVDGESEVGHNSFTKETKTTRTNSMESKAKVASITGDGNLNVKTTKGGMNFEGTEVSAAGDVNVDAGQGDVTFAAAKDVKLTKTTVVTDTLNNETSVKLERGNLPDKPALPDLSLPEMPSMPDMPGVPDMPNMPSLPNMPNMPSMPDMPSMPGFDRPNFDMPDVSLPKVGMPEFNMPDLGLPGAPEMPNVSMPDMPGLPGMPQQPGASSGAEEPGISIENNLTLQHNVKESISGGTVSRGGFIKSGGNTSLKGGKATLEGTKLNAGGDVNVDVDSLNFKAARNTQFSASTESNEKVTLDVKVKKGASGVSGKGRLGYGKSGSSDLKKDSQGVAGSISSGGNLNIKTRGDASFEGTNIDAGGNANISSTEGAVDMKAVRDTSESRSASVSFGVGVSASGSKGGGTTSKGGGVDANFSSSDSGQRSSTAKAGTIKSGGNISIESNGDTTLEGTNIKAGNGVSLESKNGNVNMSAAKSTSESRSTSTSLSMDVSASRSKDDKGGTSKSGSLSLSGEQSDASSSSTQSKAVNITSGSGGTSVKSKKDVNLEGTQLNSAGSVSLEAGGQVNKQAAKNSSSSSSSHVGAGIVGSSDNPTSAGAGGVNESTSSSSSTEQKVKVNSGSNR